MNNLSTIKAHRRRWLAAILLAVCGMASAHDFKAGSLVIDHPYATPSLGGVTRGALYFRTLKNTGREADRLIGARTPVASSVEIHSSTMDGDVMRMRQVEALELSAGSEMKLRHSGGSHHLMLVGLKQPLKEGDRFPVTLRFERAGEREVTVWVQQPRDAGQGHDHH